MKKDRLGDTERLCQRDAVRGCIHPRKARGEIEDRMFGIKMSQTDSGMGVIVLFQELADF